MPRELGAFGDMRCERLADPRTVVHPFTALKRCISTASDGAVSSIAAFGSAPDVHAG